MLVVDARETAALDALTERCGEFLCAEDSAVGASRVAVDGEPLRNVVASVCWNKAQGTLSQGYVAHGYAESAKYAFDEAASEGLAFALLRDEADIVFVTAEYLSTLRTLFAPGGRRRGLSCYDEVNMRGDHRICYADLLTAAMADPRGAAVALHDKAVRMRHTVFESYQTTMPPGYLRYSKNDARRKNWEPKTKWRLHEAHLLEQEQRAAAAAAAAQEEEAAVAAAAEDAMDTSDVNQESMEV